jgi:oxygen-independent coproporphyrinogen-3 oxidase
LEANRNSPGSATAGCAAPGACLADEPAFGSYFVSAYPPFSRWLPASLEAFAAVLAGRPAGGDDPLVLYLHLPFCAQRCRYCYYLAHDDRGDQIDAYLVALQREAEIYGERPYLAGRRASVVYVGGGTPSLLSERRIETLLSGLQRVWSWSEVREVTFECAPRSVTRAKLRRLRDAGVTRVSLGVQQLDDQVLARNGRIHRVADVEAAWEAIQAVGFPVVNVDLMTGMVGETDESFARSFERVRGLAPDSVTLYQLEIPLNTPLYRDIASGREQPPAPWEVKRRRLVEAFDELAACGYRRISAYAAVRDRERHGFLYQSLQYAGADLLGLGVSAFSYLAGVHQQNDTDLDRYVEALGAGAPPWGRAYPLNAEERLVRELVLQLKLGAVDRQWFRDRHGADPGERFAAALRAHQREGLLEIEARRITVTRLGFPVVDRLLPAYYLAEHRGGRSS